MDKYVAGLMSLFDGLSRAYGTFEVNGARSRDNKKTGKVTSIQAEVTPDVWLSHLKGKQAIGIVPIRDDSTVVFGAIDIDVYDGIDHGKLATKIDQLRMPLVPCRSKSGGIHAWIFLSEPTSAALVQRKLRDMAAALGHGRAEVFPKQTEVLPERGDIGSWINMPYFGDMSGGRYGLRPDGTPMGISEFVQTAELKKVSPQELTDYQSKVKEDLADGPPCLQFLITQSFPAGTRNNGLYNLGVYSKKAFPDTWEQIVEQYNIKYMDPPLGSNEVKELVKSLKKRDYQYTCTQVPLTNHCNSAVCRGRKYGVGDHSGMPVMTGLTKYNSCPPIWFADIEGGGRLELSTEDLQSQGRFQRCCMESLNSMPSQMNQKAWVTMIQSLLESVTVIEAPQDATPRGQLNELIEKYCTQRAQAMTKEEIRMGKPYTDGGRHFFTVAGLMSFLERHKFKTLGLHEITSYLKNDLGATHHFFNVKGKGINAWSVSEFAANPELDVPKEFSKGEVF
jgi:hypothetical protein